ncbi:ATPase [Aeromicrobium sp.]|uniref:ATPase n=1 Tax=Aeromicrobium sp. TaxID=1871063 RepID=UPI003C60737C
MDANTTAGATAGTTAVDELDRIDRSIDIDATADRVWSLISQPGWWINDGTINPDQVVERDTGDDSGDDTVVVVRHEKHGEFRVRTIELDQPRYAAFRWLANDDHDGTLVEFWVEDRPGGVVLRVVESGFSGLSDDRPTWLTAREGNVEGWATELAAARTHLT